MYRYKEKDMVKQREREREREKLYQCSGRLINPCETNAMSPDVDLQLFSDCPFSSIKSFISLPHTFL